MTLSEFRDNMTFYIQGEVRFDYEIDQIWESKTEDGYEIQVKLNVPELGVDYIFWGKWNGSVKQGRPVYDFYYREAEPGEEVPTEYNLSN